MVEIFLKKFFIFKKILSRGEKIKIKKTFLEKKLPPFLKSLKTTPADDNQLYRKGHLIRQCIIAVELEHLYNARLDPPHLNYLNHLRK